MFAESIEAGLTKVCLDNNNLLDLSYFFLTALVYKKNIDNIKEYRPCKKNLLNKKKYQAMFVTKFNKIIVVCKWPKIYHQVRNTNANT